MQDLWIKHRTIIINYGASNWGDELVTYKGTTVTYTGANIKKVDGWTYSYGYNNLLTKATKGTSGTAGYEKVTFCFPPEKVPYIVDETVDEGNMGTYNYAPNSSPGLYHISYFLKDMIPYYLYGNTPTDNYGIFN